MSDPSQAQPTTSASASEPVLCKLGCGFFGNDSTGGYCSKCWRETQKAKEAETTTATSLKSNSKSSEAFIPLEDSPAAKKAVETVTESEKKVPATTAPLAETTDSSKPVNHQEASSETTTKKKKKKKSYKSMMASMMKEKDTDKDEDETIRKMTGGGAFSKIDKI